MKVPKKAHYTAILEFVVLKPRNDIERIGEKLKLSAFGEFCPDNSLRGYDLLYLLCYPENYRVSKVVIQGEEINNSHKF